MAVYKESGDIEVVVDEVIHMPSLDAPLDRPHPFVYFLSIHNNGDVPVSIRGRKWIVENELGETLVVEGEGVVGQMPVIEPGDTFSYNSYHVISCDSSVRGAFYGLLDGAEPFMVPIRKFELKVPE